jgi:hypothetical protein
VDDVRTGNPAVDERPPVALEVGPRVECPQHPLHLREYLHVTRVRVEEGQDLVELPDLPGGPQATALEPGEQRQPGGGRTGAVGAPQLHQPHERIERLLHDVQASPSSVRPEPAERLGRQQAVDNAVEHRLEGPDV